MEQLSPIERMLTEDMRRRAEWELPFAKQWVAELRKKDPAETAGMTDEQVYRAANQFSLKLPLAGSAGKDAAKRIRAEAYANVRKAGQGS